MNIFKYTMLGCFLTLSSLVGACDSGTKAAGGPGGSGAAGSTGSAGTTGATGSAGAAGGMGAAGGAAGGTAGIPLVDWVTDLTTNHTDEVSAADTVEDKVIIDTSDPAAFDPLLAR